MNGYWACITLFAVLSSSMTASARDECVDQPSTLDRSNCYFAAERNAQTDVLDIYNSASKAIDSIPFDQPIKEYIQKELRDSQAAWKKYAQSQCSLEADATMGSAAAEVLPECLLNMEKDRTEKLTKLRDQLTFK